MVREAVAIFKAPGINIAGHARRLKKKVNELDGILKIEVNYILDTVSIVYDSDKVTFPRIRKALDTK